MSSREQANGKSPANHDRKPSLLLISHTYVVKEHAKKLPELARHFDLTCVTIRPEDLGTLYGLEGEHFGGDGVQGDFRLVALPAWGSVASVTRFFLRGLTSIIWSRTWDYVLVENEPWSFLKWQTLLACRLAGHVRHCGEFTWENVRRPGLKGAVLSLFYRATAGWSDFVIAGNRAAAEIVRRYGVAADRVKVCPQVGVDADSHRAPVASVKAALRTKWSLPAEGFVVGFAGRFVAEKGVSDLVGAVEGLPADIRGGARGLHLMMIGHGPLKEGLLKRTSDTWLHVKDAVPHHELPEFLRCLDLLILGSHPVMRDGQYWEEQFGHILIEATACGALACGSTSGAIPEVLDDPELTFSPGDVPAIQSLIERHYFDRALLERKKGQQHARLMNHYTHAAVADRCAKFLLSLPERNSDTLPSAFPCHP